jgi:hypothetical protein
MGRMEGWTHRAEHVVPAWTVEGQGMDRYLFGLKNSSLDVGG